MLKKLISKFKREPEVSGVSICLLQKRPERYSSERLNKAMSQALKRDYDKQSFFALNLDDEGAVVKIDRLFIVLRYFERRIDGHVLGNRPLPPWAEHSAHSVVEYKRPGGLPEADLREQFYSLLGLICAELADANVTGLVFTEEHVIVPNDPSILKILRNPGRLNPKTLPDSAL